MAKDIPLDYMINVLNEECAELIQAICKAKRFGIHNYHPDTPEESNMDKIINEMADVTSLIDYVKAELDISYTEFNDKKIAKIRRIRKWYKND